MKMGSSNSGRFRRPAAVVAFALTCAVTSLLFVSAAQADGTWGTAVEVPGFASVSTGAGAVVNTISCSSDGNCGAIGEYTDASNYTQAYVANETNGNWGNAIEVPGIAALNWGGAVADLLVISCASTGNCSAGGTYTDLAKNTQAFVVNETNGMWGTAIEVPGYAALNSGGTNSQLYALSCSSPGNCAAGGAYQDTSTHLQSFVVNETNGTWGTAIEVPGTAALNADGGAIMTSIACSSTGNCAGAGVYADSSANIQTYVVNETNGTWGTAVEMPGLAALNSGGYGLPVQISCSSAGNCGVGGSYTDSSNNTQAFVENETNGTWGGAIEIPGTVQLNAGGAAIVFSIDCNSSGGCSAGGYYTDSSNNDQAFVENETSGIWGTAVEVSGTAALNIGGSAGVLALACGSVGNCSAGGNYTDSLGNSQGFVVNETDGTWGVATEIAGLGTLNAGQDASVSGISCNVDGSCSAGGYYTDVSTNPQGFFVSAVADIFVPGSPSIKATSPSKGVVAVSVTGAGANGGSPITGYQYSLNGKAWKNAPSGASRTVRLSHLAPGRIYHVKLRARNAIGTGASSRTKSVKVK